MKHALALAIFLSLSGCLLQNEEDTETDRPGSVWDGPNITSEECDNMVRTGRALPSDCSTG